MGSFIEIKAVGEGKGERKRERQLQKEEEEEEAEVGRILPLKSQGTLCHAHRCEEEVTHSVRFSRVRARFA